MCCYHLHKGSSRRSHLVRSAASARQTARCCRAPRRQFAAYRRWWSRRISRWSRLATPELRRSGFVQDLLPVSVSVELVRALVQRLADPFDYAPDLPLVDEQAEMGAKAVGVRGA